MKENKEFSHLELEEQDTSDSSLILENDQPMGDLVIDEFEDYDWEEQQPGPLEELATVVREAEVETNEDTAAEVRMVLNNISKALDMLIDESEERLTLPDYNGEEGIINTEFRPVLDINPEKDKKSSLVPDLYERKDWSLVVDEEEFWEEPADKSHGGSGDKPASNPIDKKSLSTLATALLAGGGVLVFGLATAGVVTAIKSYREKSKSTIVVDEPVQIKPTLETPLKTASEQLDQSSPLMEQQKPVEQPEHVGQMCRRMPPQRPPLRPFFGYIPPQQQVG